MDLDSHLAVISHGEGPPTRVDPGAQPAIPRVEQFIGRPEGGQFHGLPVMQDLFKALKIKMEAESRPDRRNRMRNDPHYVRAAQIGVEGPRLLQLPVKATEASGGVLEQLVKEQLPRRHMDCRAYLVRQDSSIISQEQVIRFDAENVIWALVLEPQGSNFDDTKVPELAKQLMKECKDDCDSTRSNCC